MKTTHKNSQTTTPNVRSTRSPTAANDNAHLDDALAALVARAFDGDATALGALHVAVGPVLVAAALSELGPDFAPDAQDVVHDFYAALLEGESILPSGGGRTLGAMAGVIRAIARKHREVLELLWGEEEGSP